MLNTNIKNYKAVRRERKVLKGRERAPPIKWVVLRILHKRLNAGPPILPQLATHPSTVGLEPYDIFHATPDSRLITLPGVSRVPVVLMSGRLNAIRRLGAGRERLGFGTWRGLLEVWYICMDEVMGD